MVLLRQAAIANLQVSLRDLRRHKQAQVIQFQEQVQRRVEMM
jgi:hypothetical protein